ncbi:putative alpha,alpha-trehalose-phosphate synthase [UDP-forming] 5-like isoform X1 [Capsicum annuum]|uniref:RNA-binding protein 34 n=1 Tax=Capsicum annuum TaxID=4072 RepID=UPI001FB06438|nr:RNA-binding protein 34 [Capsicum annuum]KAF3654672.1 putative alpha,alpha-trehalose-phosphate synthase [UDP-forming] 5-like isoform X1 [Capsicum annuum]KAF3677215.1 putative alpha,alpha-trehalose-phosphate synthase [UDP-forming] 5-like isoform X1 [Capsicum annuum]
MAKKSKDKQKQEVQQQPNNETSNSSDIFNTLFGTTPTDSNIASLFSDQNPFKRKPTQQPKLDDVLENNDSGSVEETKKKKKKGKNVILGMESVAEEGNEEEEEGGKSKRVSLSGIEESNGVKKKGKKVILDAKFVEANEEKGKKVILNSGSEGVEGNELSGIEESNGVKKKGKKVTLGAESVGEEGNEDKGSNPKREEEENGKKMKKKRKRDEIEAEYEAKRYGVVAMEEVEKGIGEMMVGEKRKKMDNPKDMMVSNEGFDDESKLLRTVFVGNLPLKIKKKALLKEFGSFGEIESVRIRSIPVADSATPRKAAIIKKKLNDNADSVNAYVVFKSEESAQASLAHNMAVVEGRHIRVDRACPPRKKMKGDNSALYDNKKTVFVGNLPFDVKDEEIYQLFSGTKEFESSIEAVRVIRDPNTLLGKGIAYVLFKTREAANIVSRKRNLKLRDRELRVSHSKANATPSKRKSLPTEDRFRSPAKKFAVDSTTPGSSSYKAKTKSDLSYQGVKASKSGVQKKTQSKMSDRGKLKPKTQISQKPKERTGKRPSVAARKAKALKAAASGLKQTGTKRKLDNRTPDTAGRKKKFRKS